MSNSSTVITWFSPDNIIHLTCLIPTNIFVLNLIYRYLLQNDTSFVFMKLLSLGYRRYFYEKEQNKRFDSNFGEQKRWPVELLFWVC